MSIYIYRSQRESMDISGHDNMLDNQEMGTNDLYLIKKLKESGVSFEKLILFSKRLKLTERDQNLTDKQIG